MEQNITVLIVVLTVVMLIAIVVLVFDKRRTPRFIGIDPGNIGGTLECIEERVTRYMVADGDSLVELEQSVSQLLKEGLVPVGGVGINSFPKIHTSRRFLQAMIKIER